MTGRYFIASFDRYSSTDQMASDGWLFTWGQSLVSNTELSWHSKYLSPGGGGNDYALTPNLGKAVTVLRGQTWFKLYMDDSRPIGFVDASSNLQLYVSISYSTNTISVVCGSTTLFSTNVATLTLNSDHCVELYALASTASAGTVQVILDGNTLTTLTGVTTCANSSGTYARLYMLYAYIYEVAIDYEATADSPFKKGKVMRMPLATLVSNSGYTLTGATDALTILNTTARSTSVYLQTVAQGSSIEATPTALDASIGGVRAVQYSGSFLSNDAGVVTAKISATDGTNTVAVDAFYPAASFTDTTRLAMDTAPDGTVWTPAKFDATSVIFSWPSS